MKYALKDIPALLRTPLGRKSIYGGVQYRAFPLYAALASHRRKTTIRNTCLVAVVGSLGKTTTMRMATAALGMGPERESNNNQFTGLAQMVLRIPRDAEFQVVEVGINQPGQMERFAAMLLPDIAVVTSIASEHRRLLKDDQTTRHEKAFMVRALPENGTAVLAGDDQNVIWMASQTSAPVVTFGQGEGCDVRASDIEFRWPEGTRFSLHVGGRVFEVNIRLTGWPMVHATLAGIAAAWVAGRDLDSIIQDVGKVEPTIGRLAPVLLASGACLLEDTYKSPIESILAALDTLDAVAAKRKFIVIGNAPERLDDPEAVFGELGRRLATIGDRVFVMGTHYQHYLDAAQAAGLSSDHFVDARHDMDRVVNELNEIAGQNDVILIKGYYLHLERLALRLLGRKVACDIPTCESAKLCRQCPMLERGWGNARVVM